MRFLQGRIPFGQITVKNVSTKNAFAVTVTGVATEIVKISLGALKAGDILAVTGAAPFEKGLTAGNTSLAITRLGAAGEVVFLDDLAQLFSTEVAQPASSFWDAVISGFGIVLVGTAVNDIQLRGFSSGSNSTVAAGQGQLRIIVFPGS